MTKYVRRKVMLQALRVSNFWLNANAIFKFIISVYYIVLYYNYFVEIIENRWHFFVI